MRGDSDRDREKALAGTQRDRDNRDEDSKRDRVQALKGTPSVQGI